MCKEVGMGLGCPIVIKYNSPGGGFYFDRLQIAVSSFVSDSYMYVALIGPGEHLQKSFPYSRYNSPGAVKIKASSRGVVFYG